MPMFSILPLNLFSLLGLNTVALQSLPDDSSNQASHSLITAATVLIALYSFMWTHYD